VGARWARRLTWQGGRSPIAHDPDGDPADAHKTVEDLEFFSAFSIVKGRRGGHRRGHRRGPPCCWNAGPDCARSDCNPIHARESVEELEFFEAVSVEKGRREGQSTGQRSGPSMLLERWPPHRNERDLLERLRWSSE
jgi:hypothetical protein